MAAACLTPRWSRVLHWIQSLCGLKQQNVGLLRALINLQQQKNMKSICDRGSDNFTQFISKKDRLLPFVIFDV